jgi:hypothetical protein
MEAEDGPIAADLNGKSIVRHAARMAGNGPNLPSAARGATSSAKNDPISDPISDLIDDRIMARINVWIGDRGDRSVRSRRRPGGRRRVTATALSSSMAGTA